MSIEQQEEDFARDLIALCRKHNVRNINAEYTTTSPRWQRYRVQWSEGRHGDKNDIKIFFDSSVEIKEEA